MTVRMKPSARAERKRLAELLPPPSAEEPKRARRKPSSQGKLSATTEHGARATIHGRTASLREQRWRKKRDRVDEYARLD